MAKRLFDIVVSLGLIAVLFLPGLIVMGLIRLDSPGPALFRQKRVGRHGRLFTLFKLRTMRAGTAQTPTHEAKARDVTRLGSILRRTKLDELPQLWNVLVGEMSLVGPRPCLPTQTELIAARDKRGVLALRPGITGLAQSAGVDMSDPERLARLDAGYLGRARVSTDLSILFGTVSARALADRVGPKDET